MSTRICLLAFFGRSPSPCQNTPPLYLPSHCTIRDSETSFTYPFCTGDTHIWSKMSSVQVGPGCEHHYHGIFALGQIERAVLSWKVYKGCGIQGFISEAITGVMYAVKQITFVQAYDVQVLLRHTHTHTHTPMHTFSHAHILTHTHIRTLTLYFCPSAVNFSQGKPFRPFEQLLGVLPALHTLTRAHAHSHSIRTYTLSLSISAHLQSTSPKASPSAPLSSSWVCCLLLAAASCQHPISPSWRTPPHPSSTSIP
jgi:hypothetical protein